MTLLIISSDCVMRRVASGERKGIRWKMWSSWKSWTLQMITYNESFTEVGQTEEIS